MGFAALILAGAILLALPVSGRAGQSTPFSDALFTATSAVCVTGLVVYDTAAHWSAFGQAVILFLIQVGGLGVVTAAVLIAMLAGRKIGLKQRSAMQESVSAPEVGGIVRLTGSIVKGTLLFEAVGAVALMPVFCAKYGAVGLWISLFHSVSSFCNAGFDLMGRDAPFSSLTGYAAQPLVNLVTIALIVGGGLGFLTWQDVKAHKWRIHRYRIQSKVILAVTGGLLLFPFLSFFFFEFSEFPPKERFFLSLFQSATTRTAGFNSVELTKLSEAGQLLMIFLMLVGGSPGSTAGGMKTTTLAVLLSSAISVFRRKESVELMGRRLENDAVRQASALLLLYLFFALAGGGIIARVEKLSLLPCVFEAASAIATVGLSLGITPSLSLVSKGILMALMFLGRIGGLTFAYAAVKSAQRDGALCPVGKITVG